MSFIDDQRAACGVEPIWRLLRFDPLADIRATAHIERVTNGGVLYDADGLDELWPRQKPYGDIPWIDPAVLRSDDRSLDLWKRLESGEWVLRGVESSQ